MARMHEALEDRRKFTVDEVLRMSDAGVFDDDEHIELLDGELLTVGEQSPEHSTLTVVLHEVLLEAYGPGVHCRDHSSVRLGVRDLPEPDIAIVRGRPREYLTRLPTGADMLLIVEVARTSHARDRYKAGIYARSGVPEYWILDIPGRRLTVHRGPSPDGYALVQMLPEDAEVVPPGTQTRLRIADLLP
jgi:Uma2 family endonuclease